MRRRDLRQSQPSDRVFRHLTEAQLRGLIDEAGEAPDAVNSHTVALLRAELAERGGSMSAPERVKLTEAEHLALLLAAPMQDGIRVRTEPVCTTFGPDGVYLVPLDGEWQIWALRKLAELRNPSPQQTTL